MTLSKQVANIKAKDKDEALYKEARSLEDRLICAKQILNLGFDDELMVFVAQPNNQKAQQFCNVILAVEKKCKEIGAELLAKHKDQQQQKSWATWTACEIEYRKALYKIAYQAIKTPTYDFKKALKTEQAKVLSIVDPELQSWTKKALIVIANFFISVLTLGIANFKKHERTGTFWFFVHTNAGEKLHILEDDIVKFIRPEAKIS